MAEVELSGERFEVAAGYEKFWRTAGEGRWEATTFEAIARCVDGDTVVLDIGAWIGPTVLFAARRARRVIAFEPDGVAAAALRRNLALNPDIAPKVLVREAAVWTETGRRPMGNRAAPGDSMSSLLDEAAAHVFEVDCIAAGALADLVEPDAGLFIKIDVEGAEYAILPALRPLLERPRVDVLVAFHPRLIAPRRPRFPSTRRLTREAFAVFDGFDAWRVDREVIARSRGAALASRTGLWLFEAKNNYLFRRQPVATGD